MPLFAPPLFFLFLFVQCYHLFSLQSFLLELKGGIFAGITEAFSSSTDTNTQGVSVEIDEKNVIVDIKAILEYGQSAPRIFSKVKDTIREKVKEMTGLNVTSVNMKVSDIMTEKEYKQMKEEKE